MRRFFAEAVVGGAREPLAALAAMPDGRIITNMHVVDVQKRRTPSKHYVSAEGPRRRAEGAGGGRRGRGRTRGSGSHSRGHGGEISRTFRAHIIFGPGLEFLSNM